MPKTEQKVSGARKVEALIATIEVLASHVNRRFVADSEKVKAFSRCLESQPRTATPSKETASSD